MRQQLVGTSLQDRRKDLADVLLDVVGGVQCQLEELLQKGIQIDEKRLGLQGNEEIDALQGQGPYFTAFLVAGQAEQVGHQEVQRSFSIELTVQRFGAIFTDFCKSAHGSLLCLVVAIRTGSASNLNQFGERLGPAFKPIDREKGGNDIARDISDHVIVGNKPVGDRIEKILALGHVLVSLQYAILKVDACSSSDV